jgi:catechol 2,3-dioxygenase-like lactoylglutathione lyase family enzyme
VITGIDHVVLTVRDPEASAAFFARVLGLAPVRFGSGRLALQVGRQKINLQSLGQETRNHAAIGCGDLCLLTDLSVSAVLSRLGENGVPVIEGPVTKTGALGAFTSVYFNDPDGNLIEVSRYPDPTTNGANK